jgi:hypothetical protein
MDFIVNHIDDLWAIISSVVTLAAMISKLTPTPKDDEVIGTIQTFIKTLALHPK